jgi:hypothetical protein
MHRIASVAVMINAISMGENINKYGTVKTSLFGTGAYYRKCLLFRFPRVNTLFRRVVRDVKKRTFPSKFPQRVDRETES